VTDGGDHLRIGGQFAGLLDCYARVGPVVVGHQFNVVP
jgi:hypothetical protein